MKQHIILGTCIVILGAAVWMTATVSGSASGIESRPGQDSLDIGVTAAIPFIDGRLRAAGEIRAGGEIRVAGFPFVDEAPRFHGRARTDGVA